MWEESAGLFSEDTGHGSECDKLADLPSVWAGRHHPVSWGLQKELEREMNRSPAVRSHSSPPALGHRKSKHLTCGFHAHEAPQFLSPLSLVRGLQCGLR